ncbi:MAG: hypothetical protein LC119_00305 [Burkholderiales bacterium]|nr:hypothetical protein [Burkholderiales bacterium]
MSELADRLDGAIHIHAAGQIAEVNLEAAVGRARVDRAAVRWQGATTLRARAREKEQRRQRTAARLNQVRSVLTRMVTCAVGTKLSVHAA